MMFVIHANLHALESQMLHACMAGQVACYVLHGLPYQKHSNSQTQACIARCVDHMFDQWLTTGQDVLQLYCLYCISVHVVP